MKFSSVLLVAGAALVAAQSLESLPTCAKDCASELLMGTDCGMDPKCICSNKEFIENIRGCVAKACTTDKDRDATVSFAAQICKAVQIDIDTNLPSASTTTSSAPTATGTSTAPLTTGTGSSSGGKKNDTVSTPPPTDEDPEGSAAGKVGGSVIGVIAALGAAVWML